MNGFDTMLSTAMRIKQLKTGIEPLQQRKTTTLTNKNNTSTPPVVNYVRKNYSNTNLDKKFKPIKDITIVTPAFSSLNAIVSSVKIEETKTPKKQTTVKKVDKDVMVKNIEKIKEKDIATITSKDIVTQTTEIIKTSEDQLKEIQQLIKSLKAKKSNKNRQASVLKMKNKLENGLSKKRIMSSLSSIDRRLKVMQEKYFERPKIVYKSVEDCFTQISNACEVIFEKKQEFAADVPQIEDTLTEIENHLDIIVKSGDNVIVKENPNFVEKFDATKAIEKLQMGQCDIVGTSIDSFSMFENNNDLKFGYIRQKINDIEKGLKNSENGCNNKNISNIHQQIYDVEKICEQLGHILQNDDESIDEYDISTQTDYDKKFKKTQITYRPPTNMACGDEDAKSFETSVRRSRYLMKELKQIETTSKIKIFSDCGLITREIRRVSDECNNSNNASSYDSEETLAEIIETLSLAMKNSFYAPHI